MFRISWQIKDLKRQLQSLQKKYDKAQEQLTSMESPSRQDSYSSRHSRDDSLSSVKGVLPLNDIKDDIVDGEDKEDIQTLLDKIASLQQEKWLLEEKVNHLESTSSSLAEDVLQKSTIIQNYYMETKADHVMSSATGGGGVSKMSPMRLMNWAKGPSGGSSETMAEINRKMQRALEETLMKNIHLQKNIDMLTSQSTDESTMTDK
jgi:hypothetical protein